MSDQSSTPPPNDQRYQPQWQSTTRLMVAFFLVLGACFALYMLRPVMGMLVIAFLITFLMHYPVEQLTKYTPLPWALNVVITYILLIAAVLGILLLVIPPLISGTEGLVRLGEDSYDDFKITLEEMDPEDAVLVVGGFTLFDFRGYIPALKTFILGPEPLPDEETPVEAPEETDTTNDEPPVDAGEAYTDAISLPSLIEGALNIVGSVTDTVTSAISSITNFAVNLFLAIFVSFLVLLEWPNLWRGISDSISDEYYREMMLLTRRLDGVWSGFFRGQGVIGILIGGLTYIQLALMGIPQAPLLAIATGLLNLIPTLGGILALVPLALVPLLQGSSVFTMPNIAVALLVLLVNFIMTQIIWNVVSPMILGDLLDLPLPVVVVGVFVGAAIGGILGAFLVAPVISTLRVVVSYLIAKVRAVDPYPDVDLPPHQLRPVEAETAPEA